MLCYTAQNLIRIEYQGQLVLTYKQVAMGLNCSSEQLRSLYRGHKTEFAQNVHFFNVEGEALHILKREVKNAHFNEAFMKGGVTNYHADFQDAATKDKILTHAANLLVGHDLF